ncbi:MAG: hypothetical protein ACNYNX_12185 [Leucobacter sp.]
MAKKNEALFEESSQGSVSAITAVGFVLSMVLAFGGLILASYGFDPALGDAGAWIFSAGMVASFLGFALPFTFLAATGK